MPMPLPPNVPLSTKPPGPPITPLRAIALVAGVLTGCAAVLLWIMALAVVAIGVAMQLEEDEPEVFLMGRLAIVYGVFSIVAASAGLNAAVNIARSRHFVFGCIGTSLMLGAGIVPFPAAFDVLFLWSAYLLVLLVPAIVLLVVAKNAFERTGREGTLIMQGPTGVPSGTWPQPQMNGWQAPPPTPDHPHAGGTLTFHPPPPPMPPSGWPPPYPYPNPPRPLWLRDLGRERAVKAGVWLTLSSVLLVLLGMVGVIWPTDEPGFGFGVAALLGSIIGMVGAYLALMRVRKSLAITFALFVLVVLLVYVMDAVAWDGLVGLVLFSPLLVLPIAGLWTTVKAFRPVASPFTPPMPVAPPPPYAR